MLQSKIDPPPPFPHLKQYGKGKSVAATTFLSSIFSSPLQYRHNSSSILEF